jgi:hypothetical protein
MVIQLLVEQANQAQLTVAAAEVEVQPQDLTQMMAAMVVKEL